MIDTKQPAPLGPMKYAGPYILHDDPVEALHVWAEYAERLRSQIETLTREVADRVLIHGNEVRLHARRAESAEAKIVILTQELEALKQ